MQREMQQTRRAKKTLQTGKKTLVSFSRMPYIFFTFASYRSSRMPYIFFTFARNRQAVTTMDADGEAIGGRRCEESPRAKEEPRRAAKEN